MSIFTVCELIRHFTNISKGPSLRTLLLETPFPFTNTDMECVCQQCNITRLFTFYRIHGFSDRENQSTTIIALVSKQNTKQTSLSAVLFIAHNVIVYKVDSFIVCRGDVNG